MNLFELYETFKEEKKQVPIGSIWENPANPFVYGHLHIVDHTIIDGVISGSPVLCVQYDIHPLAPGLPIRTGFRAVAKTLIDSEWRMITP